MHTAVVALGGIVLVGAVIGFVRSLWHPPRGEGNRGDDNIAVAGLGGLTEGHPGGFDGGGHSGT